MKFNQGNYMTYSCANPVYLQHHMKVMTHKSQTPPAHTDISGVTLSALVKVSAYVSLSNTNHKTESTTYSQFSKDWLLIHSCKT